MCKGFLGLLFLASSAVAWAQGADVGLVNLVSGDVRYTPTSGSSGPAKPFMRVREGDRFNVPAGGQVRVVYFGSARQERWSGPASFRTGNGAGESISGGPVEVAVLPSGVPQRIARVPELIQSAKLGGIQVRGGLSRKQEASLEQQTAVREAREIYERMRKDMPADDITPELYLYAVLYDYLLVDDMKAVVDEMLRKQPGNDDVKQLLAWVNSRRGQ
jgi:hypothetical protein